MNEAKKIFLKKYQHLFWYINKDKLEHLSDGVIVEFIFNYGDWLAIKELCNVIDKAQQHIVFYENYCRLGFKF